MRGIPGVMGGVESHCEELLPRIAERAPHLGIVAIGRKPYIGNDASTFGDVKVVPLPSPQSQSTETLVSSFLGVLYARRIRANTVHIHGVASGTMAPLARMLGMKVILTIHGADYQRAKWGTVARTVLRLGERMGVRTADAVICVAPSLTKGLQAKYPGSSTRIHYVPNGAPPLTGKGDEQDVLQRFGLTRGKFILAVGRVEQGKGFELLIDAVRRSGDKRKLLIVGGAQHESEFASELLKRADDRVIFAGVQPRGVLFHLYRAASLFVLPSFHEGLPICALEAGSAGCPVLLSDIPGNRDLALPETHYFRSEDVESLSAALQMPAQQYAVSPGMFAGFDWDHITSKTLSIYNAVTGQPA
ncbi:glycosyltransferase involved in cell wall biosynthesis [Sphingomonas sp. F9_3S_D5_B_2]